MDTAKPVHIFLVEDNIKFASTVKEYLERHQFIITIENDGNKAVERILRKNPDLVILDILLPGKDGRTICRELRGQYHGPIVMLTALDEEVDQVLGLELGADEYITKPVQPRLLLSKINALLRFAARSGIDTSKKYKPLDGLTKTKRIMLGDLKIHIPNRTVLKNDQPVDLTTSEFDLFLFLAVNAGQIISRDRLYNHLKGMDYDGLNRSIDINILRLREKIGDNGKHPRIIKSIRGEGYLMVKPT